jgi:hypothetical protein
MRLQFEESNNQMLLKQLNHARKQERANFFRSRGAALGDSEDLKMLDQQQVDQHLRNDGLTLFEQQQ